MERENKYLIVGIFASTLYMTFRFSDHLKPQPAIMMSLQ